MHRAKIIAGAAALGMLLAQAAHAAPKIIGPEDEGERCLSEFAESSAAQSCTVTAVATREARPGRCAFRARCASGRGAGTRQSGLIAALGETANARNCAGRLSVHSCTGRRPVPVRDPTGWCTKAFERSPAAARCGDVMVTADPTRRGACTIAAKCLTNEGAKRATSISVHVRGASRLSSCDGTLTKGRCGAKEPVRPAQRQ